MPKTSDTAGYPTTVVVREYGCVRCQTYHREGDPLYEPHLMCQSKHGVRDVAVYDAILEAAARAK